MTLRSLIAADIATVVLNTDEFAEQVEYRPVGDSSRTVTVAIVSNRTRIIESESGFEEHVEELVIRCLRDPSNAKGGIDRPRIRDEIIRGEAYEPDSRPYLYSAMVSVIHPAFWDLAYERRRLTADAPER